jgi:hypothetical protein
MSTRLASGAIGDGCAHPGCTRTPTTYLVIESGYGSTTRLVCDAHCVQAQAVARRYHGIAYRLIAMGLYERPIDWSDAVMVSQRR